MTETDEKKRFLGEAEECRRQAVKAVSPLDQQSWLRMANEWTDLAKDAERRRHLF
jgi:hypothetical protein